MDTTGPVSRVDSPRLLLPHFQNLRLLSDSQGVRLAVLPDWLRKVLGIDAGRETAAVSSQELESGLPGLLELVGQVVATGQAIADFRTVLTGPEGSHEVALAASVVERREERTLIEITVQDVFPSDSPAHLEAQTVTFFGMVGKSRPMRRVFNKIRLYGAVDAPVLILGETGAGKERVAAALHQLSRRHAAPFVAVNCSAISETLFESELFGHEKGSFTGAVKTHKGRFERAHTGTLFLDEIGDLPLTVQTKLLRVLEDSSFERVGGEQVMKVNVRVIAATNKNLERDVVQGKFRADLFYRLNALQVQLPPLRERFEDVPLLVNHFIQELNRKYDRRVYCLSPEALHLLQQYQWPGNIRELRNLMERLFAETHTEVIGIKALAEWYEERMRAADSLRYDPGVTPLPYRSIIELNGPAPTPAPASVPSSSSLSSSGTVLPTVPGSDAVRAVTPSAAVPVELTIDRVREAFRATGGNITRVAEQLGVHKATVYRFLKKSGLDRNDLENLQ
jgi:sigma-54 specific flagellar transcriptional regulator A